ncbi:MAG: hypothetical protein OQK49_04690, partial [Proteobacteria bacterium]|nr:hypothetical protein [Pseudomonadota bacterium]
ERNKQSVLQKDTQGAESTGDKQTHQTGQYKTTQSKSKAEPSHNFINLAELNNNNWPQIFKDLPIKGMTRELARNLMVLENKNNTIIFALDASVESFKKPKLLDKLRQSLAADKQNYTIEFCVKPQVDSVAKKQADADRQVNQQRQQNKDSVVDALQKQFDATIINEKTGQ